MADLLLRPFPPDLKRQLKAAAALHGVTLLAYCIGKLSTPVKKGAK